MPQGHWLSLSGFRRAGGHWPGCRCGTGPGRPTGPKGPDPDTIRGRLVCRSHRINRQVLRGIDRRTGVAHMNLWLLASRPPEAFKVGATLYKEPRVGDWGPRGTESAALPSRIPVRQPMSDRMKICFLCGCDLTSC